MTIRFLSLFMTFCFTPLVAQYSTPNTGVHWTLDDIAANSPTTVTVSGNEYTLHENLLVEVNDSLSLNENLVLKIAADVEIEVKGFFSSDADEITITAVDPENPYEGFWMFDTSEIYFNNTLVEYGGGIRVITPDFLMENSEVSNNNKSDGSATGGAISFSNGSPVVRNSTFRNNIHPALSSGATNSVAIQVENCLFEGNNTTNNNRPQINMGPSGTADSTRIINNTIIGNRDFTVVGGVSVSSLAGVQNQFVIKNNTIRDNRYGFTSLGPSSGVIENNILEDNDTETNPMNGGSGISLYNTEMVIIKGNEIRRNLWGITVIGTAQANLGSDDAEDLNPGGNIFSENGNGGEIYALFNNTPNPIKALHNCWIEGQESTAEDVESVISHVVDDPALGEVFFDPFECGIVMETVDFDQKSFRIYPNPAKNSFQIESVENGTIKIFDLNGKLIQTEEKNSVQKQIQIRLPKGIYLVEFETEKSKSTQKLIIR
ncbi:T9SS type A sorting domain-containing protein [Moheibacter lacus]|uniref:T9SS type A sorting domain-containing protein n=1 Tax=Moheibacter lacus TaxID=2745851 RepID=A0A838ZSZ3_9FLAO|nr:T9SS type A sorting domain-containing protein [Moheibacter lacus]MBA5630100.1 T9SS type A sorting domain-containing protein [Moheibacter lacus]